MPSGDLLWTCAVAAESERRIRANDAAYNLQFNYSVSFALLFVSQ